MPKRVILANPSEPRAGDYSYELYDRAHPVHGDPKEIARIKRELAGLRGKRVTLSINGAHIDEDAKVHHYRIKRTFVLNRYSDLFGPGSAYGSAIHYVRTRNSDETLVTYSLVIEESDDEDSEE